MRIHADPDPQPCNKVGHDHTTQRGQEGKKVGNKVGHDLQLREDRRGRR